MDTQMKTGVATPRRPGGVWSRPVLEVLQASETAVNVYVVADGGAGLS
jgi:hypothetical protein